MFTREEYEAMIENTLIKTAAEDLFAFDGKYTGLIVAIHNIVDQKLSEPVNLDPDCDDPVLVISDNQLASVYFGIPKNQVSTEHRQTVIKLMDELRLVTFEMSPEQRMSYDPKEEFELKEFQKEHRRRITWISMISCVSYSSTSIRHKDGSEGWAYFIETFDLPGIICIRAKGLTGMLADIIRERSVA